MSTKKTTKKTAKKTTAVLNSGVVGVPSGTYCIFRCRDAGVHAGELICKKNGFIQVKDARQIWYWNGAATTDEIAVYGCDPVKGEQSKITVPVPTLAIRESDCCQIAVCTKAGESWIRNAKAWRA